MVEVLTHLRKGAQATNAMLIASDDETTTRWWIVA